MAHSPSRDRGQVHAPACAPGSPPFIGNDRGWAATGSPAPPDPLPQHPGQLHQGRRAGAGVRGPVAPGVPVIADDHIPEQSINSVKNLILSLSLSP